MVSLSIPVYGRLQKKPALVGKFDAQLKEISSQTVGRFGQQALSAEFLGGSLDYLIGVYKGYMCVCVCVIGSKRHTFSMGRVSWKIHLFQKVSSSWCVRDMPLDTTKREVSISGFVFTLRTEC